MAKRKRGRVSELDSELRMLQRDVKRLAKDIMPYVRKHGCRRDYDIYRTGIAWRDYKGACTDFFIHLSVSHSEGNPPSRISYSRRISAYGNHNANLQLCSEICTHIKPSAEAIGMTAVIDPDCGLNIGNPFVHFEGFFCLDRWREVLKLLCMTEDMIDLRLKDAK